LGKIIFATGNKGKIQEVSQIFNNSEYKIISLYDLGDVPEIEETGETFEANAFLKAKTIFDIYKKPVIADDSGLEVELLDGMPGVISARYAGENCTYEDNNLKLLDELSQFPKPHLAKFVCCAVYYDGNKKKIAYGYLHGKIISEFKGQKGFGYDPVFMPNEFDKTLAELGLEEKNKISHRGKAFEELKKLL